MIDKCPANGYEVATYEIPDESKIVAFKYSEQFDSSYNHILLDFEPLIAKRDIEWRTCLTRFKEVVVTKPEDGDDVSL